MKKIILLCMMFLCAPAQASVDYDGSGDLINFGTSSVFLNQEPFSFSAWIYPRTLGASSNGHVVCKRVNAASSGRWVFDLQAGNAIRFLKDGTTDLFCTTVNGSITLNRWQHVAVTWDGGTDSTGVKIYINGLLATYVSTQNGVGLISDTGSTFNIGNQGDGSRSFDGMIDDAAFWNVVLTDTEIQTLAFSSVHGAPYQVRRGNLIGYWPFDDYKDGQLILNGTIFRDRGFGTTKRNGTNTGGNPVSRASRNLSYQ